ncbi:MAG: hypothetical protein H6833_13870 [Planctomycetes bacterium]|nr:hypothetical protein [Planctomycetota bacterium]
MTNATITTTAKETAVLIAYLNAGIDCNGADTVDAMLADNMTWGDVLSIAKATDMPQKTVKGVIASLDKKGLLVITDEGVNGEGPVQQVLSDAGVRYGFELLAQQADAPAPAPFTASDAEVESKLPGDATPKQVKAVRVPKADKAAKLFSRAASKDAQPVKSGTKRADLLNALLDGATRDEIAALCVKASGEQWSKTAIRAAHTTFWVNLGYGIEERADGKFVAILPKGMKREDAFKG